MAKLPTRSSSSGKSSSALSDERRDEILRFTNTRCADCAAEQFETPSGITCKNGHGGAESLAASVEDSGESASVDFGLVSGETVTATWGEERFSPVQYNTFGVGPFSFTTVVREGETAEQAMIRAYAVVKSTAEKFFDLKCTEFLESVRRAAGQARK